MAVLGKIKKGVKKMKKLGKKVMGKGKKVGKKVSKKVFDNEVFNRNQTSQLTPDEQRAVKLTHESYQAPNQRSATVDEYQYQPNVSHTTTAVYYSQEQNHVYIAYRGSASLQDALTDVKIAQHKEGSTQRFQKDLQEYDQITQQYNASRVTLIGHSLGGGIALFVNMNRPNVSNVLVINPAFNLANLKESFKQKRPQNVVILRTQNDPVSVVSNFSGFPIKTLPITSQDMIQSHKLGSFENLVQ